MGWFNILIIIAASFHSLIEFYSLNLMNNSKNNKTLHVSFIEVIEDNINIGELNKKDSINKNDTMIDEGLDHVIFNLTEKEKLEDLKEKMHNKEELDKLRESGKKCFYGVNCLYGLASMLDLINGTTKYQNYSRNLENDEFNKYFGDKNKYRFITLDNELKIFLIENDLLYSSSLSLGINVGSAYDPKGVNGISFLLTQELFKKEENNTSEVSDFKTLIEENNGYFNIESNPFSTIYSYNIKSKYFEESIKNFSKCLKRKLFTRDSIEDSINEVSEITKLFSKIDSLKEQQLMRNISNPKHIFHNFPYGNNDTLRTIPRKDNIFIREEVVNFKNKYYSPHLMTLSIATNLSLNTIEKIVRDNFSDLLNNNIKLPSPEELSNNVPHPYDVIMSKFIEIEIKDPEGYITLEFPIPDQSRLWEYKLVSYVNYFLTQRYQGGLLDYLVKLGWANDIKVNVINDDTGFSILVIKIILIQSNKENLVKIVQSIFATIDAVKATKPSKYLLEQIRRVEQGRLKQYICTGYYRYAKTIIKSTLESKCMPEDVLKVPYDLENVDFKYIKMFMEFINPYNMVMKLSLNKFSKNAQDFLLSNEVFGESNWNVFSRKFMSFFRSIFRLFKRPRPGEYSRYIEESYLHARYYISPIPDYILNIFNNSRKELAIKYLNFNITDIIINYPKQYTIYTYDIPPQVHPELLVDSLAAYIKYTTNTTKEVDEVLINKVLSSFNEFVSPLAYSTFYYPINVGIPKISLTSRLFIQPKSLIVYGFQSLPKANARLVTISYLFMKSFKYAIGPDYSDGIVDVDFKSISELQTSFIGIEFKWTNYTSSFENFFVNILNGLKNYNNFVTKAHLSQAKSDFETILNNLSNLSSSILAEDIAFDILNFYIMTLPMFYQALKEIKLADVFNFASYIINMGSIESLVIGNCTPIQVNSYLVKIERLLKRDFGNIRDVNNFRYLDKKSDLFKPTNASEHLKFENSLDLTSLTNTNNLTTDGTRKVSTIEISEIPFLPESNYKGKWVNRINMNSLPDKYRNVFYLKQCSHSQEDRSVVYLEVQIGEYSEEMLAFLQLIVNFNIQSTFKEFVSSQYPKSNFAIKPYVIGTSYLLLKLMISSSEYDIINLTSLTIQFYNKYFIQVSPLISKDEFKKAITSTVSKIETSHSDMKYLLEQYTNSLLDRKSDPNWKYIQVSYLLNLNYNEFLNLWGIFLNSSKVLISILKTHVSAIEIAEANSFELEGFYKLNSTNILKKVAIDSNFIPT